MGMAGSEQKRFVHFISKIPAYIQVQAFGSTF